MARKLRETHYSLRSTFFRNNYEEPGDEFEIDPEDPVGLVSSQLRRDIQDEIHSDVVPGVTYESSLSGRNGFPLARRGLSTRDNWVNERMNQGRSMTFTLSESSFRSAARRASTMRDAELIRETLVLREFIGSALKALVSPIKALRGIMNRGLFQSIGRGLANITKKALGGQKDADRNFALSAEKQFIDKFATKKAGEMEINLEDPNTVKAIVKVVTDYADELNELTSGGESVFPRYGKLHHGGKGEDEEEGETTDKKDRQRFAQEQQQVNVRLKGLVEKSGILRGMLFALRRANPEIKVNDAVVDATYPLSYVVSNLADIQNAWGALDEKFGDSNEFADALTVVTDATENFQEKFRPEMERLQRKMLESAIAKLIANRAILQERRLLD